ncbi:hypothetical protein OAB57_00025 [Bacteriovoracaceae bacterium]|nr:hypothetical protein [Bacteriovoracaceae bacterium]
MKYIILFLVLISVHVHSIEDPSEYINFTPSNSLLFYESDCEIDTEHNNNLAQTVSSLCEICFRSNPESDAQEYCPTCYQLQKDIAEFTKREFKKACNRCTKHKIKCTKIPGSEACNACNNHGVNCQFDETSRSKKRRLDRP